MDKGEARNHFQNQLFSKFDKRTISHLWRIVVEDIHSENVFEKKTLDGIIARLISNEPIQYITGVAWFMDLKLSVNSSVLIPRPETEELVDHTLRKLDSQKKNPRILDIGTGSGCIALAIKKKLPDSQVYGLDISSDALKVAKINSQQSELDVKWIQGDIFSENPVTQDEMFDVIISNPPYITKAEQDKMDISVLEHEPDIALFTGNEDPLLFYKAIVPFAKNHLKKSGFIALECNEYYCQDVANLYGEEIGQNEIITDMQEKDRFVFSTYR